MPAPSGRTGDRLGVERGGTQVGGRRQCRHTAILASLFICNESPKR